jgi:hypothetical protein
MGPETTWDDRLALIKNKTADSRVKRTITKNLQQVTGKINSKNKKPVPTKSGRV